MHSAVHLSADAERSLPATRGAATPPRTDEPDPRRAAPAELDALLLLELAELKLLLLVAVAEAATSERAGPESSV